MAYKYYQPNTKDIKDKYGDCVIRSLTKAMNKDWLTVFDELHPIAREMQCPYNMKVCYEKYITNNGFKYHGVSNAKGTKRPTVESFSKTNNKGTYILRVSKHIVTLVDGIYYDTWDCKRKSLYGYWVKES
jgi:hypothetical protein